MMLCCYVAMNGRVVLVNKLTSLHLLAENKNWGEKISENFSWNACISENLCVTLQQRMSLNMKYTTTQFLFMIF